jgi:hypothetical protein
MKMYENNQDNITPIDGNVTIVNDDDKRIKAHKIKGKMNEKNQDNITTIDGDVTIVYDDGKRKKAHKSKFNAPLRKPTKLEKRKMMGKSIEILIVSCMKNHVYKFQNQLRVQSEGGPIGLALTGEVADCFMNNWDKKFIKKTESIGIKLNLYSR